MSAAGESGAGTLGEAVLSEHGQRFLEVSNGLFVIGTLDGEVRWVNAAWERLLGIPRDAMLGYGYLDFIHPDDRRRTEEIVADREAEQREIRGFKNRYRAADGSYKVLDWTFVDRRRHRPRLRGRAGCDGAGGLP